MANKFHAIRCKSDDGLMFDSKKELRFYNKVRLLKNATDPQFRVVDIKRQVRYDMIVEGVNCGFYKLDFEIELENGKKRYFDVKGFKKGSAYQIFALKKKIVQAIYNIKIEEV